MLPFPDAIRHNVRVSWLLFGGLFSVLLLLGIVLGANIGSPEGGAGLAVFIFAILAVTAYFNGSSIVLSMHGAREASVEEDRVLSNVVEEMAIASGMPKPKVYVIDSAGLNAFAAGRNPEEACVAVTTGLIAKLNREELQGVVAHELAHIKGRDTLYGIFAAVLVGAVALLSDFFLKGLRFGSGRSSSRSSSSRSGGGGLLLLLLGIVLAILAPIAARILQMSISREREYHADARAAEFTRNPLGLASALAKIGGLGASVPGENRGTQHLFIVNPLHAALDTDSKLMSTHPPTDSRIRRLKSMAGLGSE